MEAFLYCWTNVENNKMYIGSHVGSMDDGYVCSSKAMIKEYKSKPSNFKRSIVAHGNEYDIRNLETVVLKNLNAANSDSFYNLNNHAYPQKAGWKHSSESKAKISVANIGNKKSCGKSIAKSDANKKRKINDETKLKMSKSKINNKFNQNKIWINDGTQSIMINKYEDVPRGYTKGRGKRSWRK